MQAQRLQGFFLHRPMFTIQTLFHTSNCETCVSQLSTEPICGFHTSLWKKSELAVDVRRNIADVVRQTAGEVLTYDGQLIDAVYFSCSGGATEAAVAVWGTDVPYLQAVESPGEEAAPRFSSRAVFSPEEFSQRLMQENPDVQLNGSPDTWLGETTRSAGGGAATCSIGGVSFSGTQLRRMFGLNSTRLTLSYQDGDFVFDVTGFGHRVGMSQYGAQTMARLGFSYQTILQYYYQGAEVERQ